jgi:hypothetical protein
MYPCPPQLWEKHAKGGVGVSEYEPGLAYWFVANGVSPYRHAFFQGDAFGVGNVAGESSAEKRGPRFVLTGFPNLKCARHNRYFYR